MAYTNVFADWTKDYKGPDFNQFINQGRRIAEINSTLAALMAETLQAITRQQTELLRSNTEHALKASKDLLSSAGSPETAAAKHADHAKSWLEHNVNSAREIIELGTKSAQEAFEVVNKHISEQVKEFSDAAGASHTTHKKKAA